MEMRDSLYADMNNCHCGVPPDGGPQHNSTKNLGSLVATSNWNSSVGLSREPELVPVDDVSQPASRASSTNLVGCALGLNCRLCTSDAHVTNFSEFNSTTTQRIVRLEGLRKDPKIFECDQATKAKQSHPGLSSSLAMSSRLLISLILHPRKPISNRR
jgi:hypothetical protein